MTLSMALAQHVLGLVVATTALLPMVAHAQAWKDAPAYNKSQAQNVLSRSTFFIPTFGAVYREKFVVLLQKMPFIRGVVIQNHGCAGQMGWETHVSQFYYRQGFAVVAPEFVTRAGNKLGCPGATPEVSLRGGGERFREGVFTARNPARLSARGDDILEVLYWLQRYTTLPIFLSGHSEGCRTVYHWVHADAQIVGGICHKQSLGPGYEHLWRWNPELPMWSSLEDEDPWSGGSRDRPSVGFESRFEQHPTHLTTVRIAGSSHDPLMNRVETESLSAWLSKLAPRKSQAGGFDYEAVLPDIQDGLGRR